MNERITDVSAEVTLDERLELICECGEPACQSPISVTRAEYEAVRSDATHFMILPGHEHPEFERVVDKQASRFAVVEKFGEAQDAAEEAARGS